LIFADVDIGPSAPPTDWGIEPRVALEAKECAFVNSPDTAEESAEKSAKESEPNPAQPTQDPATSQKKGSFFSDWKGIYKMEWPNVQTIDCQAGAHQPLDLLPPFRVWVPRNRRWQRQVSETQSRSEGHRI